MPWRWWRLLLYPDANGNIAAFNHSEEPDEKVSMRVEPGGEVLVNPPAFQLVEYYVEIIYDEIINPMRVHAHLDVVWYSQPGPRWLHLDRMTCDAGEYVVTTREPTQYARFYPGMPFLDWPQESSQGATVCTPMCAQTDPRRPEQKVLDAIEELVNEQLQQEASGYDHDINQDSCELCGKEWHGLPGGVVGNNGQLQGRPGCPGAFATQEEIKKWRRR